MSQGKFSGFDCHPLGTFNLSQGHYVGQMTGTDHGYEYFTMLLSQRFLAIPFGDA